MFKESDYISKPICTLEELINWSFPASSILTLPLCHFSGVWNDRGFIHKSSQLPKVIYCHDMGGGYLSSDRTVDFTRIFPAFRFIQWHLIDIFIYFSHQLITVPPISWINLAHRQGVSVYGTVIVEGVQCNEFQAVFINPLESNPDDDKRIRNYEDFAVRLDQIRRIIGFEGWFINFEVPLLKDKTSAIRDRIIKFLQLLRSLGSEVIWYDAVTWSGFLNFQNELTHENLPYMKAAGSGLFLNYNWDPAKLRRSQELAINAAMSTKVFVGIDCFGRGCIGGGGFGTVEALKVILDVNASRPDRPLSVALFAPGWVFEKCDLTKATGDPNKAFELIAEQDSRFWSLLSPFICRLRGISSINDCIMLHKPTLPCLPVVQSPCDLSKIYESDVLFCTTCCSGQGLLPSNTCTAQGKVIFQNGSQMSRQQIFPTCRELNGSSVNDDLVNPSFSTVQVLGSGYENHTGTCLCIRFDKANLSVKRNNPSSKLAFMELFIFGRSAFISSKAEFTIAVSAYTPNKNIPSLVGGRLDKQINLKLFVDTFHHSDEVLSKSAGEDNFKRQLLTADEATVELRKNNLSWTVLRYNMANLIVDPNDNAIKMVPIKSLNASPSTPVTTANATSVLPVLLPSQSSSPKSFHLHRVGLTWSWSSLLSPFTDGGRDDNESTCDHEQVDGFLLGVIQLRDPQWPLENFFDK